MSFQRWTIKQGDYIRQEDDDYVKKHKRYLKRIKYERMAVIAAGSVIAAALFIIVIMFISKI